MDTFHTEQREIDGITYIIEHIYDCDAETDHIGSYGMAWRPFCIDRLLRRDMPLGTNLRNEYRYFYPGQFDQKEIDYTIKWWSDHGESKHQCWLKAMRIPFMLYKQMEGLRKGDWYYFGIVVKARVQNWTIAHESLWGIESLSDDDYIEEVTQDLIYQCQQSFPDALAEIKEKVKLLERIVS